MFKFSESANWNPSLSLKFSKIFTRISFFIILFSPASIEHWRVFRNISYLLTVALLIEKLSNYWIVYVKSPSDQKVFLFFFHGERQGRAELLIDWSDHTLDVQNSAHSQWQPSQSEVQFEFLFLSSDPGWSLVRSLVNSSGERDVERVRSVIKMMMRILLKWSQAAQQLISYEIEIKLIWKLKAAARISIKAHKSIENKARSGDKNQSSSDSARDKSSWEVLREADRTVELINNEIRRLLTATLLKPQ